MLEKAEKVVEALNDADAAQTKAKEAINQANSDISLAKDDLEQVSLKFMKINRKKQLSYILFMNFNLQIDGETGEAQQKANETAQKVDVLSERLSELQKNFLKNDLDAKDIKKQADQVRDSASNAHEEATQVNLKKKNIKHAKVLTMKL